MTNVQLADALVWCALSLREERQNEIASTMEEAALVLLRMQPLSDDDIEAIAMHIRPITESGAPSWEHAIARAIERAHGI
jgi:cytochrome c553